MGCMENIIFIILMFSISHSDILDYELPLNGKTLHIPMNYLKYAFFHLNLQNQAPSGTRVNIRLLENGPCSNYKLEVNNDKIGPIKCQIGKYNRVEFHFDIIESNISIINFILEIYSFDDHYTRTISLYCIFVSSNTSYILFYLLISITIIILLIFIIFIIINICRNKNKVNSLDLNKNDYFIDNKTLMNNYNLESIIKSENNSSIFQKQNQLFLDIKQKIGFEEVNIPEKKEWFRVSYILIFLILVTLFFLILFITYGYIFDPLKRYVFLELFFIFYVITISLNLICLDMYDICQKN